MLLSFTRSTSLSVHAASQGGHKTRIPRIQVNMRHALEYITCLISTSPSRLHFKKLLISQSLFLLWINPILTLRIIFVIVPRNRKRIISITYGDISLYVLSFAVFRLTCCFFSLATYLCPQSISGGSVKNTD